MSTPADSRKSSLRFRRFAFIAVSVLLIPALIGAARRQQSGAPKPEKAQLVPAEGNVSVAHGEYLATHVAMCVQCHSGRDAQGNILESQKFKGAAIPFQSPYPNKQWAVRTPALAGLPGFTDAQIVTLLTEGHAGDRKPPRPPMPPFRMNKADAESIVAFLRSR